MIVSKKKNHFGWILLYIFLLDSKRSKHFLGNGKVLRSLQIAYFPVSDSKLCTDGTLLEEFSDEIKRKMIAAIKHQKMLDF